MSITGPARFHAAHLDSRGDHRIAMSLLVLAAVADATITVENTDCVSISYPDFDETLRSLLGEVHDAFSHAGESHGPCLGGIV